MNPEVKQKWLTALRSGEYKHGKNALRNSKDNTYCCLGVLCDLYLKETGEGKWTSSSKIYYFITDSSQQSAILPGEVTVWAGLPVDNPISKGFTLTRINDDNRTIDYSPVIKAIEESF